MSIGKEADSLSANQDRENFQGNQPRFQKLTLIPNDHVLQWGYV